jgi:putative hydrolase of the HAD superfamily
MIPIFDLDDTLYPEITYVYSGFRAVAKYLENRFGWDSADSFNNMEQSLLSMGRGAIFDALLTNKGHYSSRMVDTCVRVYRTHSPTIILNGEAKNLLSRLSTPCFLVTDGNKVVQHKKVTSLGIEPYFNKIYITHRYGIRHAKPSTRCFELIRKSLGCEWHDMIYIGDNPAKDFVNLKPLGVNTVRILTGEYSKTQAATAFDADFHISKLDELTALFNLELL